jgi:superfamily II DNA/RNA helicase
MREKEIQIRSSHHVPRPFITLEEASLPQYLLDMIHKVGFTAPTPIQAQSNYLLKIL